MSHVTKKELDSLGTLVSLEHALYEKFAHYAASCSEDHITQLCRQLADRSRQHLTALIDGVEQADQHVH